MNTQHATDDANMMDELDMLVLSNPFWNAHEGVQVENKRISAIPPKIVIHLFVHEEVTSVKNNEDSTSDVMIDGEINVSLNNL